MWPAMAQKQRLVVRYYLWANDGPWRITHRLHSDLVFGKVALRRYAGTKQKIVEVFVRKVYGRPVIAKARGGIYSFDARGHLDVSSQAEAAAIAVASAKARSVQGKVFDLSPALRHRRWMDEHVWQPSASLLQEIIADLEGRSRPPASRGIRLLKPADDNQSK
jgi:hypothetical protein